MRRALLAVLLLVPSLAACLGSEPLEETGGPGAPVVTPPPGTPPATTARPDAVGGFSDTDVFPGDYAADGYLSRVLTPGPYPILEPEVLFLKSGIDGVDIEVGVVRPDVPPGTRVPVIVVASPYFTPMSPERFRGEDMPEGALPHIWIHYQQVAENYVPHGYAAAFISVRGTAGSGGCMDLFGPKETADLDQAVTWLGTQDWSNGNVAMYGLSYSASTPWQVAALGNPHLKTIVPVAGLPSFFHYLYYNGSVHVGAHGGFPLSYWPFGFLAYGPDEGRSLEKTADGAACDEAGPSFAATSSSALTLTQDPLGFFAARDHRPGVEANYAGSIFLVQGLGDWRVSPSNAYPWVLDLEARGLVVKHHLHQGPHSFPDSANIDQHRRLDFAETLLHWFDYWLKGDATVDLGPRVQVEDSLGRWRSQDAWPPADAQAVVFHLGADGGLALEPGSPGSVTVAPDPGRLSSPADILAARDRLPVGPPDLPCPACPRFETGPFADGFRFAGLPTLDLTVVPTGPVGHVAAHLLVVGPEGDRVVGRGLVDLRLRDGADPQPVTPGSEVHARLLFEPLDVVVPAGARLALVLHQGGYEERMFSLPPEPVDVVVGEGMSFLTTAAFAVPEDAFFEPPSA